MTQQEYYDKQNARQERRDAAYARRQDAIEKRLEANAKRTDMRIGRARFRSFFSSRGLFTVVLLIMLSFSLFRIAHHRGDISYLVTFDDLLVVAADAPTIPTDWITFISTSFANTFPWGLQWLGAIVDEIVGFFGGILFASITAVNLLVFVLYFVRFLLF